MLLNEQDIKHVLRRQTRIARNQLVENLSVSDLQIAFSNAPSPLKAIFEKAACVAGYHASASEADAQKLLKVAADSGCVTALPRIAHKSAPMQFIRWTDREALEIGAFNMLQPYETAAIVKPDTILAPLIAFDRKGGRIGQGGGHYDRAFSMLPNTIKIGIAWSVQEVDNTHPDSWDIPMDFILTEREWIEI